MEQEEIFPGKKRLENRYRVTFQQYNKLYNQS